MSYSICVYCGSSFGERPAYRAAAETLGRIAAEQNVKVVYGGGNLGLMGATASAARDAGGDVFGVMPKFLVEIEGILDGAEHVIVDTMHQRKMRMFEESDAFVVLAGGVGTLEELIEILSWSRLDLHNKPIVLLNTENYWYPFVALLEHTIKEGFTPPETRKRLMSADTPEEALRMLDNVVLTKVI